MTSKTEISEVLKTDAKGRVRVPEDRRAALLDEFERSGLSGAKCAAHYGLKYPTPRNSVGSHGPCWRWRARRVRSTRRVMM